MLREIAALKLYTKSFWLTKGGPYTGGDHGFDSRVGCYALTHSLHHLKPRFTLTRWAGVFPTHKGVNDMTHDGYCSIWNPARNNGAGGWQFFPDEDIDTKNTDTLNNFTAALKSTPHGKTI